MNSLAIKNLSFALEALSRINGAKDTFVDIHLLLRREIQKAQERDEAPSAPTDPNDDIPF